MILSLRQSSQYACYMRKKGWIIENIKLKIPNSKKERNYIHSGARRSSNDALKYWPAGPCGNKKRSVNAFVKKIPILGSVIKIQRPPAIPSEKALDHLALKHRALFIKIEPNNSDQLAANSFQLDSWPLLPTKTLRLDLKKSEEDLWNNLDSDAQYSIREAEKQLSAYSIQLSALEKEKEKEKKKEKELKKFHRILKDAGKRQGFPTPSWQDLKNLAGCFDKKAWLVFATHQTPTNGVARFSTSSEQRRGLKSAAPEKEKPAGYPIAGCILLTHKKTAYYHHAATTEIGRDLLAGYLVLWEAIKLAKEQGCTRFDFEGIYDERYHKRTKAWKGFTYFKKKFGGEEVSYPHPIIKYYSPLFKTLIKIFG